MMSWNRILRKKQVSNPPAYQSYSVEDYLRKMGVDIKEVTGDE